MLKLRKLNTKGFTHDFLAIVFVVVFAIVGIGYLVIGHADTAYTSTNEFSKFQYEVGSGTTEAITHANSSNLTLQFNKGLTGYHASDTAWYQLTLPANTTATSLTANVSYVDAGYDTVFVATGSPTNTPVWKVSTASTQSNQTINLNFTDKPTVVYFGISAKGSSGGFSGTFPGDRNLIVNSYTLNGTTTSTGPTVNISASPTSVNSGSSSTVTWSSTNATSCSASGAWSGTKTTSGTQSFTLQSSSTYTLTCTGSGGSNTASTTVTVAASGGGGGGGGTGQTSNGTPIFVGTFTSSLSGWNKFGNCWAVDSPSQLRMNITSSCNPGGDGHYRVDVCSSVGCDHDKTGAYYKAGLATCTSIPINLVNAPKVPSHSWFGFAQSKDWEAQYGSWWFGIRSDNAGYNQFQISFGGNTTQWFHDIPSNAWNTLSICANNANDTSGVVYGIYLNGVRQTFTKGSAAGKQTITGYKMINDGVGSWPLSINDYTGGTPVPNEIIHGVPLIYTMGSNGLPPMPSGGWNSPN